MSFRYRNLSNTRTVCQFLGKIRSSNAHYMICASNMSHVCPVTRTCPNIIDSDSVTVGYDPTWRVKVDHLVFHGVKKDGPRPEYEEPVISSHTESFINWQMQFRVNVLWNDSTDVLEYFITEHRKVDGS